MKSVYLENFSQKSDIVSAFNTSASELQNADVLIAWYDGGYKSGAFVLFERDGKLYEVNGSHCSCYGLEGQWNPEETAIEPLEQRKLPDYYGSDPNPEFQEALKRLKRRRTQ